MESYEIKQKLYWEYQILFKKYLLLATIRKRNIVPMYVLTDAFKTTLIKYLFSRKYSIDLGNNSGIEEFYFNKLDVKINGLTIDFYINDGIDTLYIDGGNEYSIIYNFSYNLKEPIYSKDVDLSKVITINCYNLYERFFIKDKSKYFIENNIELYTKVIACHYYDFLNISNKTSKIADRDQKIKNNFENFLRLIYTSNKIDVDIKKLNKGLGGRIIILHLGKDLYLHIGFNTIDLKRHHSEVQKRRLVTSIITRFPMSNSYSLLINPKVSINDYKSYLPEYCKDFIEQPMSKFKEILVKDIPRDVIPKLF